MVNLQLLDYIQGQLNAKASEYEIRKQLLLKHWSDEEINDAFAVTIKGYTPVHSASVVKNEEVNKTTNPSPVVVVVGKAQRTFPKKTFVAGITISVLVASVIFVFHPSNKPLILNKIGELLLLQNTQLNRVYKTYCSNDVYQTPVVSPKIDVTNMYYEDVYNVILGSNKKESDYAKALFIDKQLSYYLNSSSSLIRETGLYKTASLQTKTKDGLIIDIKTNLVSQKDLKDRMNFYLKLFSALWSTGNTLESSVKSVVIDGDEYFLKDKDIEYWKVFENLKSDSYFNKLSKKNQDKSAITTLAFISQLSYLQEVSDKIITEHKKQYEEKFASLNSPSLTVKSILGDLESKRVNQKDIGLTLGVLASKELSEANNFDQALRFYSCSASRYYDEFSMQKLADLYYSGSESLDSKKVMIFSALEKDYKKSYFWLSSLSGMNKFGISIYLGDDAQAENKIANLYEEISKLGLLKNEEITATENGAYEFLLKKYPEINSLKQEKGIFMVSDGASGDGKSLNINATSSNFN